jgi:hypothetical protein
MLVLSVSSMCAQDVSYSRRLSNLTAYLGFIEKKVAPIPPAAGKGSVLVVFRTSEQGEVIAAKAISGPSMLREPAVRAVDQWKFRPTSMGGGQPVQMESAVVIDFSQNAPEIHAAKPMTAQELSPGLQLKCLNGLLHHDANSVEFCKQQLATVEHSPSAPMDRFTAQDEYGLALMNYGQDAKQAAAHFSQAIQAAPERLKASDAEWAYAYWHRAVAEQRSGDNADAAVDFSTAELSMQSAAKAIDSEKAAAYYQDLLAEIVKEHANLLESEDKIDQAQQLRSKFAQTQ